ncbi:unnamed protein product [Penicillium salamii]|uniref:Zn(2)-C6 fungal-type domain-containing protein n=1 Tax=Penicillium salamii TaxID=1612424 RepID=A0A9W4JXE1_9EURO|nr:unnamed protein product [Penicillium salamii]CAG7950653.1 unnamed protein product [Penicillium salamii]CAG7975942.1 unnamed protein product [Penicillium salamii]CAG8194811.1 unnamed protein product [Penicillium salamii]CAG8213940.1 unnamed protein product [Penicillium salamii]
MPPLRAHTKSRNGCDQCRTRRVKCDEQGPPCTNCTNRGLECTYLKVAARSNRTPPSNPERSARSPGVNPPQANSFNIDNLELMHKFSTETFQSLCVSDSETQIWQITIPRLALKHDYLMNGILALASMHIATSAEPDAPRYHDAGLQYYNRSLTPFRNAIDTITPQNCDAVFAHSIVMIAITIASPRLTATKDDGTTITENIVILFELLQGVRKIMMVSQSWIKLELFSKGEFWKKTPEELDPDTESALARLSALNDEVMIGIYAQQHRINREVISHLRHCYAKFARSADPAPVLAWLARVEKDFVDSLRCRQPFSLLILTYWGVLLTELDGQRWWAKNSGRALVAELLDALRSGDPRWESALSWVQMKMS